MDDQILYEGKERRKYVITRRCNSHLEHTRILADMGSKLQEIETDLKERRLRMDEKIDHSVGSLWEAIREKLSARVALVFLVAFTLSYVFGVLAVYRGVNANRLLMTTTIHDIKLDINDLSHDVKDIKQALDLP